MSDATKLPHGIEPLPPRGRGSRTSVDPARPCGKRPVALWVGGGCLGAFVLSLVLGLVGVVTYDHWPVHVDPPNPTPSPIEGTLWVTLVYDPDAPGVDFARMEADPALEEGIVKLGGHLRKFTEESKVLDDKGLRRFVAASGVPTLIIQAEGEKRVYAKRCPTSASEVVAAARLYKEGKFK